MSSRASFISLPREIRDRIYQEVLILSEPEDIFYTTYLSFVRGQPMKDVYGLLHPACSNQQIAREACEIYYGFNTFTTDIVSLSGLLASKIDLGGGDWFFPAEWVKRIIININFSAFTSGSLDDHVDSRKISLCCPKLRTIALECFDVRAPITCSNIINVVNLCKKLRSDISTVKLELYIHCSDYLRTNGFKQNTHTVDTAGHCITVNGTTDINWIIDNPVPEAVEMVEADQESDGETEIVKIAMSLNSMR
ncbi:hypothetical protein MMC07_007907 [Pseudocyphellaria aurata]|nr:hypothetical protein [Pseudocyphellaria aurata]